MPKRVVLIDPHACELEARFREVFGPDVPIESVQQKAENVDDWDALLTR
jgi:hypothetical protein